MQHLSGLPKRLRLSPKDNPVFRAQVRFFAWIELNHMLHCLCGPPSIPLSFNLAIVLPRWDTYCVSLGTDPCGPTPSIHRLGRGLPGYLILFDPHAFVHERQFRARQQPSQPVFFQISKHFTATPGIPLPSPEFKTFSIGGSSTVKLQDFTTDLKIRLRTLYTQ